MQRNEMQPSSLQRIILENYSDRRIINLINRNQHVERQSFCPHDRGAILLRVPCAHAPATLCALGLTRPDCSFCSGQVRF